MKKVSSAQTPTRFTSVLERSDNRLWGAHLRVPVRVAERFGEGKTRRVFCRLNQGEEFQCAILHRGKDLFLVTVNKKLRDDLNLEFGKEVNASLRKDETEYGLAMPEELRELFRQDRAGDKLFHALTRGKQRTLLYIIGSAKDPEKRIFRAIAIVNHLKANKGTINYRQLNMSMKPPSHLRRGRKSP
ncbi:MAG: YdeI/OmpD-associated family protein [Bacteroidota bacterium]